LKILSVVGVRPNIIKFNAWSKAIDVLKSNISVIRELSQSNISNLKHWTNEFYKNMKTYVIRDKNNIM
jgi:hypothetical protein